MGYIDFETFDKDFPLRRLLETCIKIDIYDEASDSFISTITGGITGGNIGISGESDVRWTLSLNVIPNNDFDIKIKENNYIWVDKYIKVYIGVYSPTRVNVDNIQYYPMGKYFPLNNSITYDPTNNQLSVSCSDPVVNLNSTRNGQYGALNTIFPAYYDTLWYGNDTSCTESNDEDDEGIIKVTSKYSVTIPNYYQEDGKTYKAVIDTGDIFCFTIPLTNRDNTLIEIKTPNNVSLGTYPIYQSVVGYELPAGTIPVTPNPIIDDRFGCLFQMMYNPRTNTKYFTYLGECEQTNVIDTIDPQHPKETMEVIYYVTYHRIRDQIITVLRQLGRFSEDEYVVDDIGEYKAMPGYPDYMEYRDNTPLWNAVPFDQEFGVGSSIWQIITTFTNLYPNYEAYFNYDGVLHINMKPDAYNDPISLYNDYLKSIYISENTALDLSVVRNVNLVYGKAVETDFFADHDVYVSHYEDAIIYSAVINGYDGGYFNGDKVAIRIPDEVNTGNFYIRIVNNENAMTQIKNGTKKYVNPLYNTAPVFDDNYDILIGDAINQVQQDYDSGKITEDQYNAEMHRLILEPNTIYVFKIKKKRINNKTEISAVLLGHFQAAGLCALVSGDKNTEQYTTFDGTQVPIYSEAYFKDVYNVETVALSVNPDSPFTCEKIGVRLQVHSGGEFENIDSNSDAVERAKWENYKSARLTDSISLTTKLVPFVNDVNFKVQYQPINEDLAHEYMVTSISHDFYGGQSSWNLMRFYEYYIPETAGEGEWNDDPDPEPSGGGEIGVDYQTWDTAKEHDWNYFLSYIWRDLYYKTYPDDYVIPDQDNDNTEESSQTVVLPDSTYISYSWGDLKTMTWRMFGSSKW